MARTRRSVFPQRLNRVDVLIEDRGPRSDYFKISQFDGYFYGGRNAFLIAGSTTLRPRSKVLVEVVNKDGGTVFCAPVPSFIEGNSRLYQAEVYKDTPIGAGKIIILGSTNTFADGTPVPDEWLGKINVRWVTDVTISPLVKNRTPIRFERPPQLFVEEKFYPEPSSSFFSQSISVPVDIEFEPKYFNVYHNGYLAKIKNVTEENRYFTKYLGGKFTGSIEFSDGTTTETAIIDLPITKIFNAGLAEANGNLIIGDKGTTIKQAFVSSSGEYVSPINSIGNRSITSSLSINYNELAVNDTGSPISFAKLRVVNLSTISGEIDKVRFSYKASTDPGGFTLLGEVPTRVIELFAADIDSRIVDTGKFNDIPDIDEYWYSATMSLDLEIPNYYLTSSIIEVSQFSDQCCGTLLDSINASPIVDGKWVTDDDNIPLPYIIGNRENNSTLLFPQSEYTLKFDAIVQRISGSIDPYEDVTDPNYIPDYSLEVYLVPVSGSNTRILERNPLGQLIGKLTPSQTFQIQNFENTEFNFTPSINVSGECGIRILVRGGFWNIANVSMKVAEEDFFSPDEVDALLPVLNYKNDVITFQAEFLDVDNNSVNTLAISSPTFFDGAVTTLGALENILYVSEDGSDNFDGRSLESSFRTIKRAAQEATNSIAKSPGKRISIHIKSGQYIEEAPITIPPFTSLLGDDLRTTVVRPTTETRGENLFLMNNGTYASGLRLEGCEIDDLNDPRSGFFFAFAPGAFISTSPYIQNCTAAHVPPDKFYVPLDFENANPLIGNGPGGMIVDDSVLNGYSPLKSMIVDAYTQVAFNGIGLCVRGMGYAQMVSFFTNFSHVGVFSIEGGHASLLNSNTTFGDYGLKSIGKRILVVPDISEISDEVDDSASQLILSEKENILDFMITKLQNEGNYSTSYLDEESSIYKSTLTDAGILIDSIASDLTAKRPGRTSQFIQSLFKGQDTSNDGRFTLPPATGFDQGAIAVFRVNDGLDLANDFILSWEAIRDYIIDDPDEKFGGLDGDMKDKIEELFNLLIDVITSVVLDNEPTYLQEFGSLITSTSHDFSYAGSGANFLGLPVNQRGIGETNFDIRVFEENGGRVFYTAGDETGDFFAGNDFIIRQETGTIDGRTFNKALFARVTPLQLALETI
jgi:hypothetical protein